MKMCKNCVYLRLAWWRINKIYSECGLANSIYYEVRSAWKAFYKQKKKHARNKNAQET